MKLGVIGLPHSGKTTVFNALTGMDLPVGPDAAGGSLTTTTAVVDVPDPRVARLEAIFSPRKTTHATVAFTDIGGLDEGIGIRGVAGPLRNELVRVDGFVHVIRAFDDAVDAHPSGPVDPLRDRAAVDAEFVLLDLLTVQHRWERLHEDRTRAKPEARRGLDAEIALMERLRASLEAGRPLREAALSPADERTVRGFGLLSRKPMLVLCNVADGDEPTPPTTIDPAPGTAVAALRGRVEAEIAALGPEDRAHFLAEYGIEEPGSARVIRLGHRLLGLLSVFTVGPDEVRAWTVPTGATALEAAGAIHTDLAKGFIRAEVTRYEDLVALGDMKAVKAAGRQRLEGRDYAVRDGDILTIRSGL